MAQVMKFIPRPLVRVNQWFIVLSVLFTWVTNQEWLLFLPLIAGLSGLLFQFNPIMRVAKLFLRKKPNEYIPEDYVQQQFNQVIAVVCLTVGYVAFVAEWMNVAYVFTAMVALAALIANLGFCVGCFIRYQWIQLRHRILSKQN